MSSITIFLSLPDPFPQAISAPPPRNRRRATADALSAARARRQASLRPLADHRRALRSRSAPPQLAPPHCAAAASRRRRNAAGAAVSRRHTPGGPLRALARRHCEPHGRLGPLILPRTAAPPILPHRRRTPRAAALAPAPPRTTWLAHLWATPRAFRPAAARPHPAPRPWLGPAASPAGRRRRGPVLRRSDLPGRAPAARAGQGSEAGEGSSWAGAHWQVGPGCQPPFLMFFNFSYLFFRLKV